MFKLRQKMCLMALIEIVFQRPVGNRVIPFDAIASQTRMPANDVCADCVDPLPNAHLSVCGDRVEEEHYQSRLSRGICAQ